MERKHTATSWQKVHAWYDEIVGSGGHYYHKAIILPKTLQLLDLQHDSSIIDLACGQGVLAKAIPKHVRYAGLDASKSFIKAASMAKQANQQFMVSDITLKLPLEKLVLFSHAAIILAIQNIEHPRAVFTHLAPHMKPGGRLIIVMNHPCFRIPRQTHWEVDSVAKIQYRRINMYMSQLMIPIHTHPGKVKSPDDTQHTTTSFHYPLSAYCSWLKESGFCIETIEEWCSDKTSTGSNARMENRARKEFPLFLTIAAKYEANNKGAYAK